jgi:hypothetical protein
MKTLEWVVNGKTIREVRHTDQKDQKLAEIIWSFVTPEYQIESVQINEVDYQRLK